MVVLWSVSLAIYLQMPASNRLEIDLATLFLLVINAGGSGIVTQRKLWASIGRTFAPPPQMTDLSYKTKSIFFNKLHALEKAYASGEVRVNGILSGLSPPSGVHPAHIDEAPTSTSERATRCAIDTPLNSFHSSLGDGGSQALNSVPKSLRFSTNSHWSRMEAAPLSPLALRIEPAGHLSGNLSTDCRLGIWSQELRMFRFGSIIGQDPLTGLHWVKFIDDGIRAPIDLKSDVWVALRKRRVDSNEDIDTEAGSNGWTAPPPCCPETSSLMGKGDNFAVYATTAGPLGYEMYATVPVIADPNDLQVVAYPHGAVDIRARLAEEGASDDNKIIANLVVELPSKLDTESAMALLIPDGQLYVRVTSDD